MKTNILFKAFLLFFLSTTASAQLIDDQIKGFTEPYRSIDVAASEMGTISDVIVVEGESVKADQLVAKLNDEVLEASLAMAEEGYRAQGKLNSARAELEMQQDRYEKLQGLFQRRHASQTELDRAQSQLEVAQAKLETVEDEMKIKELETRRIEAQLAQRRLRSPIDGVVTRVFKDQGEFVSASDPVVVNVAQLNPLLVIFSVPQEYSLYLQEDQKIRMTIGEGDEQVDGIIEFVSPVADAQSGTNRVKVRIDNSRLQWQSGVACHLDRQAVVESSTVRKESSGPQNVRSKPTTGDGIIAN